MIFRFFIKNGFALLAAASVFLLFSLTTHVTAASADTQKWPEEWNQEWPDTNFSRSSVDFDEILSGGPPRDGIPAIDRPTFTSIGDASDIGKKEPVIALEVNGEAKAYPLRILTWHEIANDIIGGVPVIVTYCPLCNASISFDRRLGDRVLSFGVSGKLRHSDMIMYDRQTESWWQQFTGDAIVGQMMGAQLKRLPSQIIPFSEFRKRYPDGLVLAPPLPGARPYGQNPYSRYDSTKDPFLYDGRYRGPVPAMAYVIAVGDKAWPLRTVRRAKTIEHGDLIIRWQKGMNSALDTRTISKGRDLGFVTVERRRADGRMESVPYDMTFAFVFKAFKPDGKIIKN